MTDPMTATEEAQAMLEGVTPGPWANETVRTSCGVCHKIGPWRRWQQPHKWRHGHDMSACIYDDYPSPPEGTDTMLANARFIAWCREGVPALIAENEALRATIELLQGPLTVAALVARAEAAEARLANGLAACDQFDGPASKSSFCNGQATAAQQIRATLKGDTP